MEHPSLAFKGDRISVIAFCHRDCVNMSGISMRRLSRLGFPVEWHDPRAATKQNLKVFLDIYSGPNTPLTRAILAKGRAALAPIDMFVQK